MSQTKDKRPVIVMGKRVDIAATLEAIAHNGRYITDQCVPKLIEQTEENHPQIVQIAKLCKTELIFEGNRIKSGFFCKNKYI